MAQERDEVGGDVTERFQLPVGACLCCDACLAAKVCKPFRQPRMRSFSLLKFGQVKDLKAKDGCDLSATATDRPAYQHASICPYVPGEAGEPEEPVRLFRLPLATLALEDGTGRSEPQVDVEAENVNISNHVTASFGLNPDRDSEPD
jgi:hypothetical protein